MADNLPTKVGHGLAKGLGIKIPYRDPLGAHADPVTRGESTFSCGTLDTYSYVESEPTSAEWLRELCPSWNQVFNYFYSLFPFLSWITRYNTQWLFGDMVAGAYRALPRDDRVLTNCYRYHGRRRRRSPGYGLCQTG